jgi:lipoprotein-anchoring transpeptidase ErfK/SrfK
MLSANRYAIVRAWTSFAVAAAACLAAAAAAGCGSTSASKPRVQPKPQTVERVCAPAHFERYGSKRRAYAALVRKRAVVARRPGGRSFATFGRMNQNGVPTVFGIRGAQVSRACAPTWYLVQIPMRPNGVTGWVRASQVDVGTVSTRIVVDLSARRVTLFDNGRRVLSATAAIGSPATPTPTGRFYVNQRLIPTDTSGPFGPGAVGISAFSNVLTGWTQGGPIAIHGTNAPWSIGKAVSNGCIRLPNPTLRRVFARAIAGTPVIIHA